MIETLCSICRNLNLRIDSFLETGRRYPTSLTYQTVDDILFGHGNGLDRHYAPGERLDAALQYSDNELAKSISSPAYTFDFDEDGQLLNPRPAKRASLGKLSEIRDRSRTCGLCGLICSVVDDGAYRKIPNLSSSSTRAPLDSDDCTISLDFDGQGGGYLSKHTMKLDRECLRGRYDCRITIGRAFTFNLHPIVSEPNFGWFGSRPYNEAINFDLARRWLRSCESLHERCGTQPWHKLLAKLSSLRLIDVLDECLVDATDGTRFIALSYVWGRVPMFKTTMNETKNLYQKSGLKRHSSQISVTVKDAMQVTKALGERYLWTDAICIVQDDSEEKRFLISNMDAIYASAVMTLVAAEGQNAGAGLPGVQPGTRQASNHFRVGPHLEVCTSRASLSELCLDSVWATRAWTCQEALLSRRLLVFTETTMHFTCSCTTWSEHLQDPNIDDAPPWTYVPGAIYEFGTALADIEAHDSQAADSHPDSVEAMWELWQSTASDISARTLTFESDIFEAAAGLFCLLQKRFGTTSLYGLPDVIFEAALLWSPMEPGKLRRRIDSEGKPFGPSWTWAGWVGEVAWMAGDIQAANSDPEKIVWCQSETLTSPKIPVSGREQHQQSSSYPYVCFRTQSSRLGVVRRENVPIRIRELQPYAWDSVLPEHEERRGVYCVVPHEQNGEPIGSVILDSSDFLSDRDASEVDFAVVSSASFHDDVGDYAGQEFHHVLALHRQNGFFERIGHGRILTDMWAASSWRSEQIIMQ